MADAGASQRRSKYTATTGTGQESTREPAGGKGESYFAGAQGTPENDRVSGTGKWKSLAQGVVQSGTDLNSDTDRFKSGPFGIVHSAHDRPSYLADTPGEDLVLPPPPPAGTIFYVMKAYNTNLLQYVTWTANDSPDFVGTYSGYPLIDLSAISLIGYYL